MRIKSTLGVHLTTVGMAVLKQQVTQMLARVWTEGSSHALWMERKVVYPLLKSSRPFFPNPKQDLLYDTATSILGILPKDPKSIYLRRTHMSMFVGAARI